MNATTEPGRVPGPVLAVERLSVYYGKVCAVREVSFEIGAGEIVAVIGPNSAGKTSTVLAIASASRIRRASGEIRVHGKPIGGASTASRMATGLRLVPQGREIFPSLTVEDNLRVVADHLRVPWPEAVALARGLFPRVFGERARTPAGNLSGGEQQMLAVARALLGTPNVLLLDEPSLGLAQGIVSELGAVIGDLRARGMAILLADQSLRAWTGLPDRIHVMVRGSIVATVESAEQVDRILGVGERAPNV